MDKLSPKEQIDPSQWYPWLFKQTIYPLHEKMCRRQTLRRLKFLEESQYWLSSHLAEYTKTRLLNLLRLAHENVAFYQQAFQKYNVYINSIEEFAEIPFLERQHLQEAFDSLRNRDYKGKLKIQSTGGSSGTPVRFCTDPVRDSATVAMRIRSHRWHEIDIGDKEVVLWGSPIELGRQDLLRTFRDIVFRSRLIYAFNFTAETMQQAIEKILAFQPRKHLGYAQSIHLLARYYLDHFPKEKRKKLCEVVFTTAEPLFDYQREDIASAFGAKVAVEYGARDAGLIAHECPQGRMHINIEGIHVEIIDENGSLLPPGETGEIVVTNFDTPSMPIIRYRTGDMGLLLDEVCPCGLTLPVMKVVGGRMSDFLIGVDDRKIHPLGGIYILREIEAIRRFQIIQNEPDQIDLLISASQELSENTRNAVQRKFDKLLGCPVRLLFRYLDDIETSASGKFRHVICCVNSHD
jgi:phenylacetate-CoA ligase